MVETDSSDSETQNLDSGPPSNLGRGTNASQPATRSPVRKRPRIVNEEDIPSKDLNFLPSELQSYRHSQFSSVLNLQASTGATNLQYNATSSSSAWTGPEPLEPIGGDNTQNEGTENANEGNFPGSKNSAEEHKQPLSASNNGSEHTDRIVETVPEQVDFDRENDEIAGNEHTSNIKESNQVHETDVETAGHTGEEPDSSHQEKAEENIVNHDDSQSGSIEQPEGLEESPLDPRPPVSPPVSEPHDPQEPQEQEPQEQEPEREKDSEQEQEQLEPENSAPAAEINESHEGLSDDNSIPIGPANSSQIPENPLQQPLDPQIQAIMNEESESDADLMVDVTSIIEPQSEPEGLSRAKNYETSRASLFTLICEMYESPKSFPDTSRSNADYKSKLLFGEMQKMVEHMNFELTKYKARIEFAKTSNYTVGEYHEVRQLIESHLTLCKLKANADSLTYASKYLELCLQKATTRGRQYQLELKENQELAGQVAALQKHLAAYRRIGPNDINRDSLLTAEARLKTLNADIDALKRQFTDLDSKNNKLVPERRGLDPNILGEPKSVERLGMLLRKLAEFSEANDCVAKFDGVNGIIDLQGLSIKYSLTTYEFTLHFQYNKRKSTVLQYFESMVYREKSLLKKIHLWKRALRIQGLVTKLSLLAPEVRSPDKVQRESINSQSKQRHLQIRHKVTPSEEIIISLEGCNIRVDSDLDYDPIRRLKSIPDWD